MKLDTAILGGMLTNMWTWSGMRCPSIISTPLPLAELPEDLPQVLAVLVVDCFLSILWAKHDVVGAHPFGVRKAVRFLCHGVLLSLAAGDLNNHHPRGKGVSLHSISVIHPQSGWFFALCTSHAGQVHEPQEKPPSQHGNGGQIIVFTHRRRWRLCHDFHTKRNSGIQCGTQKCRSKPYRLTPTRWSQAALA